MAVIRKIISGGLLTIAALSATTPAFADDEANPGSGVDSANNWNFSAVAVCLQEVAVVPVLGDYPHDHANHCSLGNVLDQTVDGVQSVSSSL
ncbi:hypothetical protein ACF1AU_22890 [Streptomyces rubrogriseus]|uniref:hypothetical protein n=1 Tax=Streptomyces rubrogriseus TaxID=194673 RepID=UPI0037029BD1